VARRAQVGIYTIRRIWLHLMTQSLATLPLGIVDSCNNADDII
jgi:hypothetical protein